jgi:small subunit ribosomal protein S6
MFIVQPEAEEEVVSAVVDKLENLIRREGGIVLDCEVLGRKRLAYEVKKHHDGIYVKINFQAPPASITPMKAHMQLSEEIILQMVVRTPVFIPTEDVEDREADESPVREPAEPAKSAEPAEAAESEEAAVEAAAVVEDVPEVEDEPETEPTVAVSIETEPVEDLEEEERPADEDEDRE